MYRSTFPHGLMFHYFHDEDSSGKGQGAILAKEFETLLHYVGIENILSPDHWLYKLENRQLEEKDLCITLDDGLSCQYRICLPILEKYNLKAFWFVYSSVFEGELGKLDIYSFFRSSYFSRIDDFYNRFFKKFESTEFVTENNEFEKYKSVLLKRFPFYSFNDVKFRFARDKILNKKEYEQLMDKLIEEKGVKLDQIAQDLWLDCDDLKALSDKGHYIGLHSYDHPIRLSQLYYDEQLEQYSKNFDHIYQTTNNRVAAMSHPCNSYNDDTLKILSKMGITCGFLSNMYPSQNGKHNISSLEMNREDCTNILDRIKIT